MLSVRRLVLIGAAVSTCFSFQAQAEYGRTAGAFDVSAGAATYAVPIWTPPGTNGLTPNLALSYSSASGNGTGGVGWHISAVSSIERCQRTIGQDGADAAIDLSLADRFCLRGNRLRLSSGTYGVAGSIYLTEIADYSRITAFGAAGNGPQYFVVEAKSGLKYEYGATTDSRVFPGGVFGPIATTPARWMLNKVYDRNGNKYVISYANTGGFAWPDVISWAPTTLGGSTYRYEAKFNYFTSRSDADSVFGKIAGFDVANRYRLENIQIKSSGVVKRKYRFSYDTSTVTSRSRLVSAKECADDAESNCFLPVTFSYQSGTAGVTPGTGTPPSGSSNNLIKGRYDFNGDGKHDVAYWSGSSWQVVLSTNSGFAGPYNTGATSASALVDDFLPTGRAALMTSNSGVLWTYRWDDGTSGFVGFNTGVSSALPTTSLDMSGDGLADLVYYIPGSNCLQARWNMSSGSGNPSFSASAFNTACLGSPRVWANLYPYSSVGKGLYRGDVNGDGRQDLNALIVYTGMGGGSTAAMILLGSNTGLDVTAEIPGGAPIWPFVDFNGDRCTDRQVAMTILISACSGTSASSVSLPAFPAALYDWDGDGKTDVIVSGGVYKSTGIGLSGLISGSPPTAGFDLDLDGDRIDDVVSPNAPSAAFSYWTHTASGSVPTFATNIPDLLSGASDGFGVSHTPNYVSTAWGSYDKGATTNHPLQEADPLLVVAQVTSSNGIGGTFNRTFYYVGARENASRSESAGFQRLDETDARNGVIRRAYFEQNFPVAGMLSQQELMQPTGVTTIARTVFTNGFATLDASANNQRYFTYPQASTTTQFEVGSAWNGSLLRTVATSNTFDNASGTLYDQTVTTTEPASGANGLTAGGVWTARSYSPLAYFVHDTANWCLGRPGRTQQINTHNLTYGSSITRTTDISWNSSLCRPTQTVAEPGDGVLQVTTGIGYDSFGNVNSTTVTGIGMTARTNSIVYSDATYQSGQFPLSATNALSQQSTSAWNYDLGVPTSAMDANGISTSWQYDAFGRRNRENRPDGTATTWTVNNCTAVSGGCVGSNNKTVVIETALDSSAGYINDAWVYLDAFDRAIITTTRVGSGSYNRADREYDALGRVYRESAPCTWSSCTTYWSTHSYDLVDRLTQVSRPISDTNPSLQYSYAYYEGLTTRTVDAQGKQTSKVSNAQRELARSADHDGYYQSFEYDSFGAPKRILDTAGTGNPLQSSTYNLRGMLTARTDMDMGSWSFTPNALGEVASQTDAKSQTTTFQFDLLGRPTQRTEAEGTSTWTWGTSSAAKNIGQLASVSGPSYSESYGFDSLGRPSTTTISSDTSYQVDYSYNNQGALDTLTYPTSTSSYRLKLQYEYQYGTPYRIKDFNAPSTVFWTASVFNSRNQITQETLGNGLTTSRSFDAVTAWLKSVQTGLSGGTGVQNLAYEWDLVGNLKKRKDGNQAWLTEEFFYDNLYRLDYSQLGGVTNLDLAYDALGNISSKSDVGTFSYHATKRHQLSSTSNGWSFGYDNNGNMTSGRNATIVWTSFNYPSSIANGSDTSSFSYTPDRQYWRQISNYTSGGAATTIYVGGLLEKVTTSGGTDYRHMIRAGGSTIIVSRQTSGTNSTHYVTSDHLGSSSAITNSNGGVLVNSSFGAFGARRGANWSGSPSGGDWTAIAATTRRGYTDHTMLDNVGLIHMNGRVQDPVLGRFVSADPFITRPLLTQNYNRYAYVYNRPLTFADPGGFDAICGNGFVAVERGTTTEARDATSQMLSFIDTGVSLRSGAQLASSLGFDCIQEVEVRGDTRDWTPPGIEDILELPGVGLEDDGDPSTGGGDSKTAEPEKEPCPGVAGPPPGLGDANRFWRANQNPYNRILVDARRLDVSLNGPLKPNSSVSGTVQGTEWFVFGRVTVNQDANGNVSLVDDQYDFTWNDRDEYGPGISGDFVWLSRNLETKGAEFWNSLGYTVPGTSFIFHFTCSPNIVD